MSLDARISTLIKRIYCARDDTQEWDKIAREILNCTGAHAGLTTLVDLDAREYSSTKFYGPENTRYACGIEEYKTLYTLDPSLSWASANPSARFCDSYKTLDRNEYFDHPYLRWQKDRLNSIHWYVGYTPLERQQNFSFSLIFPAELGAGPPESLRLFRMLFDHMDTALQLEATPFEHKSKKALILACNDGRVRDLSAAAIELFASPDGLAIRDGRLCAATLDDQSAIDEAIRWAGSVLEFGANARAVKVSRPSGKRPWIVFVRPIFREFGCLGRFNLDLLFEVRDANAQPSSIQLMQSLFALTPKELELLNLLNSGHSVESLANKMQISRNTARVHLHTVFRKTATTSQSELLKLCWIVTQP